MKKQDIIDQIAQHANLNKRQADEALSAMLEAIIYSLSLEQDVFIAGFGRFYTSRASARQGRNPQTGELMAIPASLRLNFKPATNFKTAVSNSLRSET